jgi:hypothetical protein
VPWDATNGAKSAEGSKSSKVLKVLKVLNFLGAGWSRFFGRRSLVDRYPYRS